MADEKQKLLVAVDGSEQSMKVVRYVADMCTPERAAVTLLHILSPVEEFCRDLEAKSDSAPGRMPHQKKIDAFMDEARQLLLSKGMAADAVRVAVQSPQAGIAADIVAEARRGYGVVAAGNIGFNPITRLTMGSVVSKLVTMLTDMPLWIVGGQPGTQKVLVCLDHSPAAIGVIGHVGRVLAGRPVEITLFYTIRNPAAERFAGTEFPAGDDIGRYERAAREAIHPVFKKAVDTLEVYGFAVEKISVKIVSGIATRAGTIFAQALHGGYGTIIVGRLGVAGKAELPIGTVPMKLVQLVDDLAVWVVAGD